MIPIIYETYLPENVDTEYEIKRNLGHYLNEFAEEVL